MSTSNAPLVQVHHLAGVAAGLGAFIGLNSTYAILNPQGALRQLGFPNAISPSDQKLVEGVIRMYGGARLVLGISQLVTWYFGSHTVMGYNLLFGVVLAGVDGWVSKEVIGKKQWEHWSAIPVSLGLGTWLLLALE